MVSEILLVLRQAREIYYEKFSTRTITIHTYSGLGDRQQQNGINYTLDLNTGLTQVLSDGTNTYLYGNGRIAQTNSTTEYFIADALGSVRQLVDVNSAVTLTQSYAPYGAVTQSIGSGATAYQFTGEMRDANGLIYLRARYYAPQDGRFLSRDPWGGDYTRPLSLNRWNYVEGNPVNLTDPTGLMSRSHAEFQSCISSPKLDGVRLNVKENVCSMISELEEKGYLTDIADEDHIEAAYRDAKTAHQWSTAYHILHDFVSIEDLRKTPIDADGIVWYKKEWDSLYCISAYSANVMSPRSYLNYLVKKNASEKGASHIGGYNPFNRYIFTSFGLVSDVTYAIEGYGTNNPKRLPNSTLPAISKHTTGQAVDISVGYNNGFTQIGYTEVDEVAQKYGLIRPYNMQDPVPYTDDETIEWWHFETLE